MTVFASILVPLNGSQLAAKSLGCATWLAERLDAQLHILSATSQILPAREELVRLKVPQSYWPRIMLHQAPEYPEDAILGAISRHDVKLVIMTTHGGGTAEATEKAGSDPFKVVGHVTRAVIERSPVPVLLLPPRYREALPWERVLVPISGDIEGNVALMLAVQLANALNLFVHVAHVSESGVESGIAGRARYADAAHHEYPGQLQALLNRSLSTCAPEECRCIQEASLAHGDVETELLALLEKNRISLIVIAWRGRFMAGHARVLKRLVQTVACPLLLVKPSGPPFFKLKVGEEIE